MTAFVKCQGNRDGSFEPVKLSRIDGRPQKSYSLAFALIAGPNRRVISAFSRPVLATQMVRVLCKIRLAKSRSQELGVA